MYTIFSLNDYDRFVFKNTGRDNREDLKLTKIKCIPVPISKLNNNDQKNVCLNIH